MSDDPLPTAATRPAVAPPEFDAFISYSRKDSAFAAALERALESYAPPAGIARDRRRLTVFRDEQDLTGPEYYDAIQRHLTGSRKLIVLCSPSARASDWVDDEIRRFAALHGAEHIVPVLVAGLPDNVAGDDDAERAFPRALLELARMPLAVSYLGFDPARDRPARGVWYGAWYTLLANLLDASRADIEERDRRRRRRTRNSWIGGTGGVVVVLLALTVWALIERRTAIHRLQVTRAGDLAAQARVPTPLDPRSIERRVLFAVEAVRRLQRLGEPDGDAVTTLRDVAALLPRRTLRLDPGQRDFAFSADGLFAFSAGAAGVVVHSLRTGERVAALAADHPIDALFLSGDGALLGGIDSAGALAIWSTADWQPAGITMPQTAAPVACATLSHDGRYVAILTKSPADSTAGRLSVHRAAGGELVAEHTVGLPPAGFRKADRGACLELGRDHLVARFAATTSPAIAAAVWRWRPASEPAPGLLDLPVLSAERDLFLQWDDLADVVWSSDSSSLVLASIDGGASTVRLTDGGTAEDASGAYYSAFADGGRLALSSRVDEDPYVPLLSYEILTVTDRLTGDTRGVIAETGSYHILTPGGQLVITANARRVRVWNALDGRERARIPASGAVSRLYASRSGRHIATADERGAIEVWDLAHPAERLRIAGGRVAAGSDDGRRVAVGTPDGVAVIDTHSGRRERTLRLAAGAASARLSPDRRLLLVTTGDPTGFDFHAEARRTLLVDVASGDTLLRTDSVTAAAFSPDGLTLLLGHRNGSLHMLRTADARRVWQSRIDSASIMRVGFSADGRTVAAALGRPPLQANGILVLDAADGSRRARAGARSSDVFALSRDGALLATAAAGGSVDVVRVTDGAVLSTLPHPTTLDAIRHLAFSDDGRRLLSIAGSVASTFLGARFFTEQAVFIRDIDSGDLLHRMPEGEDAAGEYQETLGEEEKPYFADIAWSADSRYIAAMVFPSRLNYWAVPADLAVAELRVWDVSGAAPSELFRTPTDPAETLLGIGDGGALVFTRGDGVRVRATGAEGLLDEACLRVSRNLGPAEWRDLIGADEPPRPTCPRLPLAADSPAGPDRGP